MIFRLAVFLLALSTWTSPLFAQSENAFVNQPKIEVAQFLAEERVPDRAHVAIGVRVIGDSPNKIARDLAAVANRVLDTLKQAGIADADTSSSGPSVQAVYEVVKNEKGQEITEKRRLTGYRGDYRIVAMTAALDIVPALVPKVSAAGGLVESVSFSISDRVARVRALEEKAVADGVERAGRLIRAAGAKPGRVLAIEAIERGAEASLPRRNVREDATPSEVLIPIRPRRETVTAEVKVTVEIIAP
jgi:uncharacterized protein YggE